MHVNIAENRRAMQAAPCGPYSELRSAQQCVAASATDISVSAVQCRAYESSMVRCTAKSLVDKLTALGVARLRSYYIGYTVKHIVLRSARMTYRHAAHGGHSRGGRGRARVGAVMRSAVNVYLRHYETH